MQDIVKNVTLFNGTSFDIVMKAIDRDPFTFAQVEEGVPLSIIFNQRATFSCFNMEARGGIKINDLVYSNHRICFSHFKKKIGTLQMLKYFICKVGYVCLDSLRHIQYTHKSPLVSTIVSYLNV